MEEIIKSKYEDVYRVRDGITLHVKKYRRVCDTETDKYKRIRSKDRDKLKNYIRGKNHRHCNLKVATEDVEVDNGFSWISDHTVEPKGSVFDNDFLLEVVTPSFYRYEIKTTGNSFSGSAVDMNEIITDISAQIPLLERSVFANGENKRS